jgi:glycosyltransferase involved in cell wall biosynthesis/1,4-dihydroxy-2-naphthoate octaprenyltransferase
MLDQIKLRTKQWWQPKAGMLLSAVYLAVFFFKINFSEASRYFLPALATILGIGLFGHFLNDWTDLESDRKVGKTNMLSKMSTVNSSVLLIVILIVALLPWFVLPFDNFSIYLLLSEFLLLFLYAFPPLRLKDRGFLALLTDALYAYAIPFLLAFHTFQLISVANTSALLYGIIFGWQFSIGMVNILIHQLEDFENDVKTSSITWVIQIGKDKSRKLLFFVFWPLMLVGFALFIWVISSQSWSLYYLVPLLFVLFQFGMVFKNKNLSAFVKSNLSSDLQKINIHYHLFLPYWNLLLLVFIDIRFAIIVFFHYLLFNFSTVSWWFKKVLFTYLIKYIFIKTPSKVLNFSIYYYRIYVLRESPKTARREHYDAYIANKNDEQKKQNAINIAIVKPNRNKYTETFIDQHEKIIAESDYYLHQLYGGYLPFMEEKRGHLISSNESILKFYEWKSVFFGKPQNYYLKQAIVAYLINNNINLVLAEFGQCGAEMYKLCQEAGVPLIVIFHGYDAYHKDVLAQYANEYQKMFRYSSAIIGVSKNIISKLEQLGAPKDKLLYLPCSIDFNKFVYNDHSANQSIFLSVGRFAETKSPHLTILAFNEVLKEIPNAQLIMIGKDGGGELFEACHILVKALKIEKKVVFKGICSPDEVLEQMQKARVFVQHSITTPINGDKEGTPVVVMEAMANGLPVVATKHAGIAELIVSGENGFLVEEYDYLNMAKMMVIVCKNDELVSQIGKKASESILNNYLIINNKNVLLHQVNKCVL